MRNGIWPEDKGQNLQTMLALVCEGAAMSSPDDMAALQKAQEEGEVSLGNALVLTAQMAANDPFAAMSNGQDGLDDLLAAIDGEDPFDWEKI
jgi:hypothetical protein